MSKKTSFFERLTGSTALEEEIGSKNEIKNNNKEVIQKDYSDDLEKKVKKEIKKEKKKEEALTESEGQLTLDVYQTPGEIVIKSTIAGVRPDDIDISITNDMVTIKGKRQKDETIKSEDYYYQECYWGSFSRSVILPVEIDADQSNASMRNGILTIRMPKIEKIKTKKIRVKAE